MSPESRNGGTVIDAITRMASQDKIGWVHFRNVAGTEMNFREVYIDEGQVRTRLLPLALADLHKQQARALAQLLLSLLCLGSAELTACR